MIVAGSVARLIRMSDLCLGLSAAEVVLSMVVLTRTCRDRFVSSCHHYLGPECGREIYNRSIRWVRFPAN